jgi:hypothetical protein
MFADLEWRRVAEATGISFYYHSPRRQSGDLKWKAEFENILKEQVICDVIPLCTRILNI